MPVLLAALAAIEKEHSDLECSDEVEMAGFEPASEKFDL
jgi:hypothetical protein